VSKFKAFLNSAGCALIAAFFLSVQQYALAWPFAGVAAIFGAIWLFHYLRDEAIKDRARQEAQFYDETPPTIQMQSKGNRLIVPAPHKSRKQ